MTNDISAWATGYAITTTSATKTGGALTLSGGSVIYGKNHYCRIIDETPIVPKDTMTIPEPKSVQCPKCEHRAIKSSLGHDWTMDVTDHDVTQTAEKRVAKENGNRARLRICAKCGNVWATILRTEEA